MNRHLRYVGGILVRARIRRDAKRFIGLLENCRATQRQTLARIMELNAESFYSRRRGLSGSLTVEQFRRALPISDFETVRDEIEQMKQGNHQSLLGPKNKLLMFALSSGTTSQAKYIPITSQFLSDYRRGWQVWGINAMDNHPALHMSDIVQLGSNHDQYRTESGTPCGNISGLVGAMQSRVVQTMYAVPNPVAMISDSAAKGYTALRCAYANAHVGLIMTANPSTLIQLSKAAHQHQEELIRDIEIQRRRHHPRTAPWSHSTPRSPASPRAGADRGADRNDHASRCLAKAGHGCCLDRRKCGRISAADAKVLR
jgi:hypothetical protein